MLKLLKLLFASLCSGVAGFVLSLVAAGAYRNYVHPGDPDPADFNVGLVGLGVWLCFWLFGTAFFTWVVYFRRPN